MINWVIGILVFIIGALTVLYYIGKRTMEKEQQFKEMFKERSAKKNLDKYKKKSTPKVPRIKSK